MRPTYYQIELTGRMLTALLVAVALLMVLAFAFGYGAAWSVLSTRGPGLATAGADREMTALSGANVPDRSPTPTPTARAIVPAPSPRQAAPAPTVTPRPASVTATPRSQPTTTVVRRAPTAAPRLRPTVATRAADDELWVQVLAVGRREAVETVRKQLVDAGFPRDHHRVVQTQVAGGDLLFKVRVGPFPDQASAARVAARMRDAGFPDAWVVRP